MKRPALDEIARRLAGLVGYEGDLGKSADFLKPGRSREEYAVDLPPHRFVVQWNAGASAAHVQSSVRRVKERATRSGRRAIPVIAVPFMGQVGRALCLGEGVSWFDLSGNAFILGTALRIDVSGKPNRFKRPGRPSSVFAPRSSRIVRWLLMNPSTFIRQRDLAKRVGINEGYASQIADRLERDGFLDRDPQGAVRARQPALLLDAWDEAYDFSRHAIRRGHIAARTSDELLRRVTGHLRKFKIDHATTGLSGAWLLSPFALYNTVTVYLRRMPDEGMLRTMEFREEPRGANVWLCLPDDIGVFHGAENRTGIPCVHPVQAYLDLKGHPERSREARERLRQDHLRWRTDAG